MTYAFNDDKSKAGLSDQFVVVVDTGSMTIGANNNASYTSNLTTEYGYSPNDYIPIAIMQFTTNQFAKLVMVEHQLHTSDGAIKATVRARNMSENIITANVNMKVLLMKK